MAEQSLNVRRGFVKQVLSGDSVVLQGPANNGPPKEITVYLANVSAPRLAKRPTKENDTSMDEPYAWEAREFLRKKIVGKTVVFVREFIATSSREHGRVYLGGTNMNDAENVTETGVSEGWLEVRPGKQPDDITQKLIELQEKAKSAKKGRWSDGDSSEHVRKIIWNIEDPRTIVEYYKHKPVDAVIEQVRDGSTVRAFLLPTFEYVTVMFSGVKAPGVRVGTEGKAEEFGEQSKYFVESRLLQRDVKIIFEGVSNQNFIGTVIHPHGNITIFLLKEGLAKCVEWSIGQATGGPAQLRDAERYAKERKLRLWKNFVLSPAVDKKSFTAKVIEIGLGDTLTLLKDDGEELKVYFSSFKPPRKESGGPECGSRQFRPLYDIPFMFEAREYLRKKLIGKTVTVTLDYIQPKSDQYPEKQFVTVMHNNSNVCENLISRGLGKVIRHKQDDDGRSPHYDALLAAEAQAEKDKKGLWSEKIDTAKHTVRVQELQGDAQRSKQFMPYLQRSTRSEGIVEFVSSGSRLRVYVPKETCIITFLLGGISCPRGARVGPGGKSIGENEPFANEAYQFTKHKCLQHDIQLEVEFMDKAGGFIGYLFYQNEKGNYVNLSEKLVESGLATVHFSAERSSYFNALQSAEKRAKEAKIGLWKNFVEKDVEVEKEAQANDISERKINFKKVVITEVLSGFRFAAQTFDDGPAIERLMSNLQAELNSSAAPSTFRRGQLAAAKFENLWHRVRIESIKADKAEILYIDFGNRDTVHVSELFALPAHLQLQAPGAKEYQLAFVTEPNDLTYARDAKEIFERYAFAFPYILLNVEYKVGNIEAATLSGEDGDKKTDIGNSLVVNGNALVERRREARFQTLISEYVKAETVARTGRRNIWKYGDFTGNDI